MSDKPKFMIGQRVIYRSVICKVLGEPLLKLPKSLNQFSISISNPKKGYDEVVDMSEVKPLPNGQL